jgi:hypothetical protein
MVFTMKKHRPVLAQPDIFPVELMLTSGKRVSLERPDVHFWGKPGRISVGPSEAGGGICEMIMPEQIAKIGAKFKRAAA